MNSTAPPASTWKSPSEAPFIYAAVGSLLLFAALPPLKYSPLGFAAPVAWILLIRAPRSASAKGFYFRLWLAGVLFWLLAVHWLRLPHWATSFGWIALSLYLGCYLPLFVGLSRLAVHRFRITPLVAAPVVWTGLELARAHLITGFLMAALGHTQVNWITFIQISDLGGGYFVSFVVMLIAACLARMIPIEGDRFQLWPAVPAVVSVAAVLMYGKFRIEQTPQREGPRVGLIQGNIDADWKQDPEKDGRINAKYFEISRDAIAAAQRPLNLLIWPETMYRRPLIAVGPQLELSSELPYSRADLETAIGGFQQEVSDMTRVLNTAMILGVETVQFEDSDEPLRFNSAIAVLQDGSISARYDKNHRVLFGEYIPLGATFPWIYQFSPIGSGLEAGESAASFLIAGTRYAPNICYESVLPHVIARGLRDLRSRGDEPDVLVNLTNDAWFWGSSELDMHLACDVFRAVESRKPMLVAANGGLTALVDSCGRVVDELPRRTDGFLLVDVPLDGRESAYLEYGDWLACVCLAASVLLGLSGSMPRFRDGK